MSIDLNKLMNYKSLAYRASNIAQLEKVKEEYKELLAEVRETSTFTTIKNMDNFIAEGLDLRIIKKSIFRKKELTDAELEEAQLEFIRSTKAIYKEKGIDLEVLEWGIQEFEIVRKNS